MLSAHSRHGVELIFLRKDYVGALKNYAYFYDTIEDLGECFVAGSFQDVISDYPALIQRVNNTFETNFQVPENGSEEADKLVTANKWLGVNRLHVLEDIKAALQGDDLKTELEAAISSYQNFCKEQNVCTNKDAPRPPIRQCLVDKLSQWPHNRAVSD